MKGENDREQRGLGGLKESKRETVRKGEKEETGGNLEVGDFRQGGRKTNRSSG